MGLGLGARDYGRCGVRNERWGVRRQTNSLLRGGAKLDILHHNMGQNICSLCLVASRFSIKLSISNI